MNHLYIYISLYICQYNTIIILLSLMIFDFISTLQLSFCYTLSPRLYLKKKDKKCEIIKNEAFLPFKKKKNKRKRNFPLCHLYNLGAEKLSQLYFLMNCETLVNISQWSETFESHFGTWRTTCKNKCLIQYIGTNKFQWTFFIEINWHHTYFSPTISMAYIFLIEKINHCCIKCVTCAVYVNNFCRLLRWTLSKFSIWSTT